MASFFARAFPARRKEGGDSRGRRRAGGARLARNPPERSNFSASSAKLGKSDAPRYPPAQMSCKQALAPGARTNPIWNAMLSNKAKYGLKALIHLAGHEGVSLAATIALNNNIPRKFLDAILLELTKAGILASKKGKGGGYQLARPADAITAGQIIRILDGPLGRSPAPAAPPIVPARTARTKTPARCATSCSTCAIRWR